MPWTGRLVVLLIAATLLAACGAPRPLPSEQRHTRSSTMPPLPRPEVYRVVRGDTLYSIAFRYGLDWRELARWNNIGVPYTIRVDQWVRLMPPPAMQAAVVQREWETTTRQPLARPRDTTRTPPERATDQPAQGATEKPTEKPTEKLTEKTTDRAPARDSAAEATSGGAGNAPGDAAAETPGRRPAAETTSQTSASVVVRAPESSRSAAGVAWSWPSEGRIVRGFDVSETRKGILIGGRGGQPVHSAAAGEVVYSGSGLIGYGELIIIKHSDRMLSAYGHNQERLVGEGEQVRAGQLIARMGRNESNQEVLHFEIRRDGRPENPINFLPAR